MKRGDMGINEASDRSFEPTEKEAFDDSLTALKAVKPGYLTDAEASRWAMIILMRRGEADTKMMANEFECSYGDAAAILRRLVAIGALERRIKRPDGHKLATGRSRYLYRLRGQLDRWLKT